jgi:hypothetical protein
METVKIRAQATPWRRSVELYLGNPEKAIRVKDVVWETYEEGACFCGPSFELNSAEAQTLMDDLWNCGVRPTEGAGTAGSMQATQRHLEDMRKLAFAKFEVVIPKENNGKD